MTLAAQKSNFKTIDLENDLGISAISSMANSEKGYIYLAGNESIYLFDGKSADPVIPEFSLPFSELSELQEGQDGLLLLSNDQLLKYGNKEALISEMVTTYIDLDNLLYYGTNQGIKVYNKSQNLIGIPNALESLKGFKINDIKSWNNAILIATSNGLYSYDPKLKKLEDYNATSSIDLIEIEYDHTGLAWSYDRLGNLYNIDLKAKRIQTFKNENYQFNNIVIDSSNRIWFGTTDRGILRYDTAKNLWKTIDQRSGLSDNRVVDILTDSWGTTWVLTADLILAKYIDRDYSLYNVYDGLPSDEITAISTGKDLLVAAGTKGIYRFDGDGFRLVTDQNVRCEAIYQDSSTLWIGTNGSGLIRIKNNESTVFSKNAGLPSDWVHKIVSDGYGSLWIATPSSGIARLSVRDSSAFSVEVFSKENVLQDQRITSLLGHSSGMVYYGTESGKLGRFSFGEHYAFSFDKQLKSEITDLKEGRFGELLIGTSNDGAFLLDNGKKGGLSKLDTFPDNVKALSYRDQQRFIANDKGVFTASSSFDIADGFPSKNILKSGMELYNGRLWIASLDGLISLGDLPENRVRNLPRIYFEDVQANYNPIPIRRDVGESTTRINYNENQISFDYEGVDIHSTKDLQYSFILEGRDKSWSPWSKNDNPSFNNLRAGSYTFRVRAKSDENAISQDITYDFIINGPLWKEWWFLPLLIALVAIIIFLFFRARIRKIRRKNEEEKAQLELKNRLLELEQKANQLQMNPHFIFNALNSIQATVAKEDYKDARREITDFATLMRSILSNSKEKTITLEDELKLLDKYIGIEKKCRGLDFEYKLSIEEAIDPEEVMIPPMLIQPFVENAIVHGLKNVKSGVLEVKFSLISEEVLRVEVVDNGVGYEVSKKNQLRKNHKSVAIDVTKERLEALLGKKYAPVISIGQISAQGGTNVELKIPVEYEF